MKVFISVDMEGISGIVAPEECSSADKDYPQWRKIMTEEANAAYAGHFGVPLVFASGDDKLCAEARDFVPEATTVIVKTATGRGSARCLSPQRTREMIRDGARAALGRIGEVKPFAVEPPLNVEVRFDNGAYVDQAICLPGIERVEARTVRGVFQSVPDLARLLSIMVSIPG